MKEVVKSKGGYKMVIEVPMVTYFQLKEKAEPLTVKQYVELLLRNVDRLSKQQENIQAARNMLSIQKEAFKASHKGEAGY